MLNRFTTPLAFRLLERDSERFDQQHGTDTARWASLEELTVGTGEVELARPYVPTPPRLIRTMLAKTVPDPSGWTFVDFGSGKGRALIAAAFHGFDRVVGVEFARELHEAAQRNLDALGHRTHGASPIELVLGDAAQYAMPAGPLAVFFNNPFTGEVFQSVLENIERSYLDDRRPIVVIYQTMKIEDKGQAGLTNLAHLDRSPVLREEAVRFRNPLDAWILRPFELRTYLTREVATPGVPAVAARSLAASPSG